MRRSVVVVDDDDISRRALTELLADRSEIEVVGVFDHDSALSAPLEWSDVDVALIDAADERRPDDHFAGVAVVEHIRARAGTRQPTVIVRAPTGTGGAQLRTPTRAATLRARGGPLRPAVTGCAIRAPVANSCFVITGTCNGAPLAQSDDMVHPGGRWRAGRGGADHGNGGPRHWRSG